VGVFPDRASVRSWSGWQNTASRLCYHVTLVALLYSASDTY
jgi:hypothetical protein